MKSNRTLALFLAALLLAFSAPSLWADDGKNPDVKADPTPPAADSTPDAVATPHQDGGAPVAPANFSYDSQRPSGDDRSGARPADDARTRDEAANTGTWRAGADQAARTTPATPEVQDTVAPAETPSTADHGQVPSTKPVTHKATHYSMDDLADSAYSLRGDRSDPGHHSMGELADSGL